MDMTRAVSENETAERLSKLSGGLVCPVCKKEASLNSENNNLTYYIGCNHCSTRTAEYVSRPEATKAWANKILY